MRNSETYYGLTKMQEGVSADNGETILPQYDEMTPDEWRGLILDIEYYLSKNLSEQEVEDIKEILS